MENNYILLLNMKKRLYIYMSIKGGNKNDYKGR
jgi:hypothetical protein